MTGRSAKHVTGLKGETLAAEYLEQHGYKTIHRRYRCRNGEIDIIAERVSLIVFVEVKTIHVRSSGEHSFGEPEMKISVFKQKALRRCAEHYLWKHEITGRDCRFDLVTVRISSSPPDIRHMENILT